MKHYSVMLKECLELLDIKEDGIYVDGTLGRGGHSEEIAKRLKKGKLYTFDLDKTAIEESKTRLKDYSNITYINDNYANMANYLEEKVDGILLDLGVSSPQFDDGDRGFSYRFDGPLDMRMDQSQDLKASDIVNTYKEEEIANILYTYGEEKNARRIAKAIVNNRPINTTFELVEVIKKALPQKVLNKKGHPAKQTFQALRIKTNNELASLEYFLDNFDELLNHDGRVVIIIFHSLEDRLVKKAFKQRTTIKVDKYIPLRPEEIKDLSYELLNHRVIEASDEELNENHRSQSAKLRGIRKI